MLDTTGNCWKRFLIHNNFLVKAQPQNSFFPLVTAQYKDPWLKVKAMDCEGLQEVTLKRVERLGTTMGFLNSYSWKQSFPEMCMTQHSVCVCNRKAIGLFSGSKNRRPLLTTKKCNADIKQRGDKLCMSLLNYFREDYSVIGCQNKPRLFLFYLLLLGHVCCIYSDIPPVSDG